MRSRSLIRFKCRSLVWRPTGFVAACNSWGGKAYSVSSLVSVIAATKEQLVQRWLPQRHVLINMTMLGKATTTVALVALAVVVMSDSGGGVTGLAGGGVPWQCSSGESATRPRQHARGGRLQGTRPNIVIIYADDLGWGDIEAFGGHPTSDTPALNALVATGMRLNSIYTSSPVCSPSRSSVMTGRYEPRFA
jgi:hypothetical protein